MGRSDFTIARTANVFGKTNQKENMEKRRERGRCSRGQLLRESKTVGNEGANCKGVNICPEGKAVRDQRFLRELCLWKDNPDGPKFR